MISTQNPLNLREKLFTGVFILILGVILLYLIPGISIIAYITGTAGLALICAMAILEENTSRQLVVVGIFLILISAVVGLILHTVASYIICIAGIMHIFLAFIAKKDSSETPRGL
jgi:hypothetical protein